MRKLQGICLVYDINSTYLNCYFKEFFKWIGISYVGCFCRADVDSFVRSQKSQLDEVIDLGKVLSLSEKDRMSELLKQGTIRNVLGDSGRPPIELLRNLLAKFENDYFGSRGKSLMDALLDIYDECGLVCFLYDYTLLLSQKLNGDGCQKVYKALTDALYRLDEIFDKYHTVCSGQDFHMLAHVLYAKYHCQKMIDELLFTQNKVLEFDTATYINEVNKIYDYDRDFLKAEYLKAGVVKLDSLYRPLGKTILNFCVKNSPADVCKSIYYYELAKWLETDNQPMEAEKMFQMSYKKNPTNVKAIFKLAVYKLNKAEIEPAKILLKRIAERWNLDEQEKQIPPRDLEYAYKANMLLAEIDKMSVHYAETAERILGFIRLVRDTESGEDKNIIEALYPDEHFRREICEAMLQRLDAKCLFTSILKKQGSER